MTKRFLERHRADKKWMRAAIKCAHEAGKNGDLPYGAVVVLDGRLITEGSNVLQQEKRISGHAEVIALERAQKLLDARTLPQCTLYTTVEPCPGCSFQIRELRIPRVVFGIRSLVMGGSSKYGVLEDPELSDKISDYFGPPPVLVKDFLKLENAKPWEEYAPDVFANFKQREIFG